MRKILLILSFFVCINAFAAEYYVTTSGSSLNGGTNDTSDAWSITHAFATAVAGDIVWIKAGDYGAIKLQSGNAGQLENRIQFIGYTAVAGDIVVTTGPTYTKAQWAANGDRFPSTIMPLLDWTAPNDKPVSNDDAISIRHPYITVKNIMVQDYVIGFDARGDFGAHHVTFDNVYAGKLGDWDPAGNCWNQWSSKGCTNNNGYGIRFLQGADDCLLTNSLVVDAGMISVFINNSDRVDIDYTECWTVNPGNGTDYMFEYSSANGGTITNSYAEREHTLSTAHTSRVLAIKCSSTNIVVENFTGVRSKIQLHSFANNNTLKNINLSGQYAELQVIASDNNTIENLEISGGFGIAFLGWSGGECGVAEIDYSPGTGNYFINAIIRDQDTELGQVAVVSFHRLGGSASAGTNYIINLTADNYIYLINKYRGGTINFYNSSFSNAVAGIIDFGSSSVTANYTNCNFSGNGYANPSGTNITSNTPDFTDRAGKDYTLTGAVGGLKDIGMDGSTINALANADFIGVARGYNGTDDIGAYEYSVAGTVAVTGVTVSPTTAEILVAGTVQYSEIVLPTNADDTSGAWSTSNGAVATVNSATGLATGVGVGTCTITFTTTDGPFTDPKVLTVTSSLSEDSIGVLNPVLYLNPSSIDPAVTTDALPISIWEDLSGLGNDGTPANTIDLNLSGANRQVEFDGTSYFTVPDDANLELVGGTDEFTLIAREGDVISTGGGYLISKGGGTFPMQYGISYVSGALYAILVGGEVSYFSNVPIGTNRLVVAVITTTTVNVWIDGVQVVTNGAVGSLTSSLQQVNIGGRTNGGYLMPSGTQMDLAAIVPSAITPSERLAIESEFIFTPDEIADPTLTLRNGIQFFGTKCRFVWFGSQLITF